MFVEYQIYGNYKALFIIFRPINLTHYYNYIFQTYIALIGIYM